MELYRTLRRALSRGASSEPDSLPTSDAPEPGADPDSDIVVLPFYDEHSGQWLCSIVDRQCVPADGDMIVTEAPSDEGNAYFRNRYRESVPIPAHVVLRGVSRAIVIPEP